MLSVFRFVLPELSSHFVLRDLRSFCLERPLPSSRVPPWDLSLVLSFLRGPPFEPLSSYSLRDLTRKVLFLLSLATARRVGELQALSAQVSSSGDDLFLSYFLSVGDYFFTLVAFVKICQSFVLRLSLLSVPFLVLFQSTLFGICGFPS